MKTNLLALTLLVGCAADADLTTTENHVEARSILLPETGTGQSRVVMNAFARLSVTVTDIDGNPLDGAQVTFTAPAMGASAFFVGGNRATTDEFGRASIMPWASSIKGTYTVWANVDGADPMPFTLTNVADEPAIVLPVLGSGQISQMGQPFADALTVEVWDRYGNTIAGTEVAFLAPASGPTMQMPTGNTTVTDDEGRASVFAVAGDQPGSYSVIAQVAEAPIASFTLTNAEAGSFRDKMIVGTPRSNDGVDAEP